MVYPLRRIIQSVADQQTTAPPLGKVNFSTNSEGTELWVTFEAVKPAGDYEPAVQWKFILSGK